MLELDFLKCFGKFINNLRKIMKKLFQWILIVLTLTGVIKAQGSKMFDAPFGIGGGYLPTWSFINTNELNNTLLTANFPQVTQSGFFSSGGAGFVYIGFVPNLRIGGMGFSGSTSENTLVGNENRETVVSIGGGGVTIEYTLPIIKNIGVSFGTLVGAGSYQIELFKNSGAFSLNDIINEIGSSDATVNYNRRLINNFFLISPTINVEIPIYYLAAVRLGVGYSFTLGDNWEVENGLELSNVPSDINGNHLYIQAGIFLGLFSY